MTHQRKRCNHCSVTYSYQGSGHGCMEPTNDPNYCPDCKRVILDALSVVPAKRKKDWVVTTDVTPAELAEKERAGFEAMRADGFIPVMHTPMGLYNMADPSNHHRQGILHLSGVTYRYEFWSKDGPEKGKAYVEVERDAETGKVLGPWSLLDNWYQRGTRKPPTLDLDTPRGVNPTRDPNVEVTFEVKPLTAPSTSIFFMESYPLISGEGNALKDMVEIDDAAFLKHVDEAKAKPLRTTREYSGDSPRTYTSLDRVDISSVVGPLPGSLRSMQGYAGGYGRKSLLVEPLPDGALPTYHKDPNEIIVGEIQPCLLGTPDKDKPK